MTRNRFLRDHPYRALSILPVLLLTIGWTHSRQTAEIPADLATFVEKAQSLIAVGNAAALKELSTVPDSLNWVGQQRGRRGQTNWKISALRTPNTENRTPEYLAVFSDFHGCESIGDHVLKLLRTQDGWRFGAEILETDTRGYRVRDHDLKIQYDLPNRACKIADRVTIERTGAAPTPCLLRLSSDMSVDSGALNGRPLAFGSVPGIVIFAPPAERRFTIGLAYHGSVNHPGSDYIRESEAVLVSYWYPHIGRLPAKHGVTVSVPKGWTAVGEGELLNRTEQGDQTVFRYRNEIPTCYFSLDAGPYVITSRSSGRLTLSVYELSTSEGRAERTLDLLEKSMAFFEAGFGPYPYTRYGCVESLGPFGGALEAYSFATFGRGAMPGAVPHELAHTWWGGIVPNPYTKSMWNESFASYSDGLYQRQTAAVKPPRALKGQHQGNQYGRFMIQGFAVPIAEACDTSDGRHAGVGYGKGSMVLAMLEDLLGTNVMIRCMRRFREDHIPGEASDWPDFQRAVNKVTGRDYGWFFEQWVNRGGVPVVKLANVKKSYDGAEYAVTAQIVQEGKPYRIRMPIALSTEDGETIGKLADISEAATTIRLTSKSPPKALALDPEGFILMAGAKLEDEKADPFTYHFDRAARTKENGYARYARRDSKTSATQEPQ